MYEAFERLLNERKLTPYRVAQETGISQSTLSDWKLGKTQPKVDKLKTLAEYFDIPVSTFIE
ncbi:MAG: helix-turn-helix domain-containing protein [Ruminococcus sp.]|nr:helix-turn-helix domain-containing protein [Ruminococcus sp.]